MLIMPNDEGAIQEASAFGNSAFRILHYTDHLYGSILSSFGASFGDTSCVPRMWASAVMTLSSVPYDDAIPTTVPREWGMGSFQDMGLPMPRNQGKAEAERAVASLTLDARP